jgi:hypothetical protein
MYSSYHFIIEDIDTSDKGDLTFYYGDKNVNFQAFWVSQFDSIMIGDSVSKDSCDQFLRFYRYNEKEGPLMISEQESVMLIGRDIFCD